MKLFNLTPLCFLVLFCITGCTHILEGEVDYSKTLASKSTALNGSAGCPQSDSPTPVSETRPCYEQLFRKYENAPPIAPGETISIHLSAAFVKDSPEWKNINEIFSNQSSNAELAILINACEQGVNGCSTSFGPKADTEGRVVFFTNAAKAKQYLNFSYLPIYGPIEYQGKPLIIQISIMELDINGEQERNLVDTLASIGKQAYPPASGVLSVLNKLGKTFLTGQQHDIIFRHSMTMTPDGGNDQFSHPVLSQGDFVFLKKDTTAGKQEADPWRDIWLDQKTGRLVTKCTKPNTNSSCKESRSSSKQNSESKNSESKNSESKNSESKNSESKNSEPKGSSEVIDAVQDYRGHTYLSIQVQSGFSAASLDNQQTLASLVEDLEQSQNKAYLKLDDVLNSVSIELSQNNATSNLGAPIQALKFQVSQSDEQKRKDQQFSTASFYVDSLQVTLNKFVTNFCYDSAAATLACHDLPTGQQLEKLIIETRNILISKDNSFSLDSKLPLDVRNASIGISANALEIKQTLSKVK